MKCIVNTEIKATCPTILLGIPSFATNCTLECNGWADSLVAVTVCIIQCEIFTNACLTWHIPIKCYTRVADFGCPLSSYHASISSLKASATSPVSKLKLVSRDSRNESFIDQKEFFLPAGPQMQSCQNWINSTPALSFPEEKHHLQNTRDYPSRAEQLMGPHVDNLVLSRFTFCPMSILTQIPKPPSIG
jgi:hypothetical protein